MQGCYFDGASSKRFACSLHLNELQQIVLHGVSFEPVLLTQVTTSGRVGNTPRYLTFPSGAVFETDDNDAVDVLFKTGAQQLGWFSAYQWEGSLKVIVLSVVTLAVVVFFLVSVGIPSMSQQVAKSLPSDFIAGLADEVLVSLDDAYFKPSSLPADQKTTLESDFRQLTDVTSDVEYNLVFRSGGLLGANAFALPDGTVVITDELIALADNKEQIQAVLLHEIGHVHQRHALRGLIESGSIVALLAWLTGDLDIANSWVVLLSTILIRSDYSRKVEWEADTYALEQMRQRKISPQSFSDMLRKMEESHRVSLSEVMVDSDTETKQPVENTKVNEDGESWFKYLSSHPTTLSRRERFEAAARQKD